MIGVQVQAGAARRARGVRPQGAQGRARRGRSAPAGRPRRPASSRATSSSSSTASRCTDRDELVQMVVGTKPGTTVPVKVLRDKQEKTLNVTVDELDLEAEAQTRRATSDGETEDASDRLRHDARQPHAGSRAAAASCRPAPTGALVTDVDPNGTAARVGPAARRRDPAGEPRERGVGGRRAAASCRRSSRAARRSCSSGAGPGDVRDRPKKD